MIDCFCLQRNGFHRQFTAAALALNGLTVSIVPADDREPAMALAVYQLGADFLTPLSPELHPPIDELQIQACGSGGLGVAGADRRLLSRSWHRMILRPRGGRLELCVDEPTDWLICGDDQRWQQRGRAPLGRDLLLATVSDLTVARSVATPLSFGPRSRPSLLATRL